MTETPTLTLTTHPSIHNRWRVSGEVRYTTDDGDQIIVKQDYLTDGSSKPPWTWILLGHPFADTREAVMAAIHDALYDTQGAYRFTRQECDWIFFEGLMRFGVNPIKASLCYIGLRIGGWWPWLKVSPARKAAHLQYIRILPAE